MTTISSLPRTQRALKVAKSNTFDLITNAPVPAFDDNDTVLIRVVHVAINPVDGKAADLSPTPGATSGTDFAGIVVALQTDAHDNTDKSQSTLKIGDRVMGFVFGNNPQIRDNGAFAEYVAVSRRFLWCVPTHMSLEAAASLPVGIASVGLALHYLHISMQLLREEALKSVAAASKSRDRHGTFDRCDNIFVLVYGGGTSTGAIAIQVLKASGFTPIACCSLESAGRAKHLGAAATFDYQSATCGRDIREYTNDSLTYAIDCISESTSMSLCYEAIGSTGGRYVSLDPFPIRGCVRRSIVPAWICSYTQFGQPISWNPPYNLDERPGDYSKHGKAVLVPSVGVHTAMIMPESAMNWAMSQPDDTLSIIHAFSELNQTKYSLGNSRYWSDPWQLSLVKAHLSSILPSLIPQLNEELADALPKHLGTDTENWKEIELERTLRKVISQMLSRFIVGSGLCRDETYLGLAYKVILGMMTTIWATLPYPEFMRSITGPISSWHTQRNISRIQELLKPLYNERLSTLQNKGRSDGEQQPQDLLMMMMRFAQKKRPNELANLSIITRRVCAANFVAMHQSTIVATNIILNTVGSDAAFNTIATLRDEITNVLGGTDSAGWSKERFSQMTKTDSVARESMRLNFPLGTRGSMRTVMKDGLQSPEGIRLQKGTTISWLASCAQVDADRFEEPHKFDPFRFSRPLKEGEGPKDAFVTTSPQYLPFGHGKHACPGRFMVDDMFKMILAHLLTHYDLAWPAEYQGKQPPSIWQAELSVPPPRARILVKRRKI
ncbi:alcohol dehydrogenase, putative [Cordyceps militaris CM01]|uniref:Alcohol dehydrogenase, putative n=1 Tax=Cordyceps militaris (strain CM01) TaxID=983644 RepID=G3JT72_CORMM|nr:alcohol dehydrogenase, putative [Cordyceps militaris CM01]EGX88219.1 alcohol dehydrogenase, putative [Cordyceps militaris CM01]